MCGIVGYVGRNEAVPILLDGLRRLEYRGYDSAGVALMHAGELEVTRSTDRLAGLETKLERSTAMPSLLARAPVTRVGRRTDRLRKRTPTRTRAWTAKLPSFITGSSKTS